MAKKCKRCGCYKNCKCPREGDDTPVHADKPDGVKWGELFGRKQEGEQGLPPTNVITTPAEGVVATNAVPVLTTNATTTMSQNPDQPAAVSVTPSDRASAEPVRTNLAGKLSAKLAPKQLPPHVEVPALAGTGKTTTILGGVCKLKGVQLDLTPSDQQRAVWDAMAMGRSDSVRLSAFNTKITDTLKDRIQQQGLDRMGVEARGIHSLGNGAVFKAFGKVRAESYAVEERVCKRLGTDNRTARKDPKLSAVVSATSELVSLCKQTLTEPTREELDELCSHYDVEVNGGKDQVYDLVPEILEACKTPSDLIHFDDMVWLPVVHGLPIYKVDLQIVDESQDLNRVQQELMYRAGRRIVFVGDMNQAIYGFAGADAESMIRMKNTLAGSPEGCVSLPLTMTRRCGRAIVREAQRYVPWFEAHESNPEGKVERASMLKDHPNAYHKLVGDGDMVLCRTNAPLVSECFRFLAMGKKANILGKKIGQGLLSLLDKSKASSTVELITWLAKWLDKEIDNEQAKKHPSDTRIEGLRDKHDCLVEFTKGLSTVDQVRVKIDSIFTDNKQGKGVTLSSIHKSKGLEANRVHFLQPVGVGPNLAKMQPWEVVQERNLSYVAVTRAIQSLYYVS